MLAWNIPFMFYNKDLLIHLVIGSMMFLNKRN